MLNQSRPPDTSLSPATSLFFSSGAIYSRDNHLSISVNSLYPKDSIDIQTASLTWTYYAWHNLRLALQNSTIIADSYTIFPGTFGLYTLFVFNLCFTLFRYSLCFALHSRLLDYFALGFLPSLSCKWLAISNSLYSCAASFPVLYLLDVLLLLLYWLRRRRSENTLLSCTLFMHAFSVYVLHLFLSCISPRCLIASFVLIATTRKRKHLCLTILISYCHVPCLCKHL